MSDVVVFMNQNFPWPLVLIGLLLWTVFIWKEWSQRKERRFWVKLALSFFAIVSLIMIILKPGIHQKTTNGKGIVLTEGYRPGQVDSLRSIYKRIQTEAYSKGRTLSMLDNVDTLFLLGHGLEAFDLWQLDNKSVAFLGGENVEGWTSISHGSKITLGEELHVNATYVGPKEGHWAILTDNGGNPLDSLPFDEQEEQLFEFNLKPKASGQFVYHLLVKNEEDVVSDEPLPIQVEEGDPLKVLMVNTFPTFETKYLKNFLTEKGHEVLARTQLTKGKYKFEYFNGASKPIYGFTEANLKDFDILIVDTDSYMGLGRTSKEAMEEVVKNSGLGIFIQPNEDLFGLSKRQSPFQFNRDFVTELNLGDTYQSLQKYPYGFQETVGTQHILVDSIAVAAYVPMQKGKIGTSVLQSTYQMVLDGQEALYAHLWTQILNGIAKGRESLVDWNAMTQVPRVDEPFEFVLRTSLNDVEVITDDGVRIPLLQNSVVPTQWNGIHYPRKTGWNQLRAFNDSLAPFSYYVFGDGQLVPISKSKTLETNLREFGSENTFTPSVSRSNKALVPISPLWFYFLLLFCLGWLWLEPKLRL